MGKALPDSEKHRWLEAFFAENGIERPKATGDYRFMSWDQARELRKADMTIGSHTLTHAIVTRISKEATLPRISEEEVELYVADRLPIEPSPEFKEKLRQRIWKMLMEEEVGGAKRACEEALGEPCDTFAYPNGRVGDFNEETTALLKRLGFSCGLTTVQGLNAPGDDLFTLKRMGVGDGTTVAELEAQMSGFMAWALGFLARLRP